jgi:peptidyl-prolyl cis-trans isomerase D
LFALPQGRARVIAAPNGAGWFIVHHQERTAGDASGNAAAIQEMGRSLIASTPEEVAQQFSRAVQREAGAERNEEAVRALRERLLSAAIE